MSELKERVVTREEILATDENDFYGDVLKHEIHHNHELVEVGGVWRWKENPGVRDLLEKISLNDLVSLMHTLGYDKNSEFYRHLYRCMGYSLYGYWEVFYWEMNNENESDYPNQIPKKSPGLLEMLKDVMNIGMSVRQSQLQGSEFRSGNEALQEYVDETYS
jgi:hypothetical protein